MNPSEHEDIERLIADTASLRALARRLVSDSGLADDVVQDAFVVALESRARIRGGIAAYVAGSIRHLARMGARTAGRRIRRETASAIQASSDRGDADVGEIAARVELQRTVAEHLLALPDPYRRILLLRYVEDLPQREIATRLGLPAATVNSQITRGLARLRERLDAATGGDRERWVRSVAPLAVDGSVLGSLKTGALIMSVQKQMSVLAAVFVTMVGGAWWLFAPAADLPRSRDVDAGTGPAASATVGEVASAPSAPVAPGATGAGEVPPPLREVASVATESAPGPTRVEIKVLRAADRSPVAGAAVYALDRQFGSFGGSPEEEWNSILSAAGVLPSYRAAIERRAPAATTDSNGAAVVMASDERLVVVFGESPGISEPVALFGSTKILPVRHEAGEEPEVAEVLLERLAEIEVTVTNDVGARVEDVPVALLKSTGSARFPLCTGRTDALGSARLPVTPFADLVRDVRMNVIAAITIPLRTAAAERIVRVGGDAVIFVLPETTRLVVSVSLDSGEPAPDGTLVMLAAADRDPSEVTGTGALVTRGKAMFPYVGLGLDVWVSALRPGDPIPEPTRVTIPPATNGTFECTLMVETKSIVAARGRLIDDQGAARSGRLIHLDWGRDGRPVTTAADGSFEFVMRVLPADEGRVSVKDPADGITDEVTFDAVAARADRQIDLGYIILGQREAVAAGTVRDTSGNPIPEVAIEFVKWVERGNESDWVAVPDFTRPRTGLDGRFELIGAPPGADLFLVAMQGFERLAPPIPYRVATDLEIVVATRASVRGRLLLDPEIRASDLRAGIWNEERGTPRVGVMGWELCEIAADGSFHSPRVKPGRYTLAVWTGLDLTDTFVAGIDLKTSESRDPRLDPLDLRGHFLWLELDVDDESGNALRTRAYALLDERLSVQLGDTRDATILTRSKRLESIVVEAEGFLPKSLGPVEGKVSVVLSTGIAVEVAWPESEPLPKAPMVAIARLVPTSSSEVPGGARAAKWLATRRAPDAARFGADRIARVAVPEPGDYVLEVDLVREGDGSISQRSITGESKPVFSVEDSAGGAAPRFSYPLAPGDLERAASTLR